MTAFETRNNHRTYDTDTHKVVPKDAVMLDLIEWPNPARLVEVLREDGYGSIAHQIEAQTKPPRIPEPGLWGVVEAYGGALPRRRWVHHEEGRWVCDTGVWRYWDDLSDPAPVRPGVEDES